MEISFRIFARNFQMHSFEWRKSKEGDIFEISNSLIAIFFFSKCVRKNEANRRILRWRFLLEFLREISNSLIAFF